MSLCKLEYCGSKVLISELKLVGAGRSGLMCDGQMDIRTRQAGC